MGRKKPNKHNIVQPKKTGGGSGSGASGLARRQAGDKSSANNVVSTESDAQELTLAINEQEFKQKKQALVNKLQDCINKCQISSAWSIGNDELNKLRTIDPIHQRDIIEIEAEIRKAEAERNDAMTKAANETDPAKKAQFIATAQAAERTIKQAKARLAKNPLSKLAQYSYINDMGRLFGGNLPSKPPTVPKNNPDSNPTDPGGNPSGGNNPDGSGRQNP
ncbi:5151_t:CDS:2 [Ambispora gerdemannii]|uniref:5151_t:CDS:1 n=1 Tax=Ambispora gerdemannii TaxID=144530 RepID=A0A9N9H2M6_9GLOM|nr:5151_t:CDS:2 [Ambispora gerdemannii]